MFAKSDLNALRQSLPRVSVRSTNAKIGTHLNTNTFYTTLPGHRLRPCQTAILLFLDHQEVGPQRIPEYRTTKG